MRFEISERIETDIPKVEVLNVLEEQFKKISESVAQSGNDLAIESIEASWGSANRLDSTIIIVNETEFGYLLVANVHYRPSMFFWIIFIITLFTYIFWLIPIAFYIIQKKTVKENIENVFNRVKNQFSNSNNKNTTQIQKISYLEELEKLAILKEKGIINEVEFQIKKKELL